MRTHRCFSWSSTILAVCSLSLTAMAQVSGPMDGPDEGASLQELSLSASPLSNGVATPETYDVGDSYRYFEADIPLLRVKGAVAVGFASQTAKLQLLPLLADDGGLLAGYREGMSLGKTGAILEIKGPRGTLSTDGRTENVIAAMKEVQGVVWSSPVFYSARDGVRLVAAKTILVKIAEGLDITDVLGPDVTSHRRLGGTDDQYVVELSTSGDGLLGAARRYALRDGIIWAEPNFYTERIKHDVDPLYEDQWHLNNVGQTGLSGADVDAPEAWSEFAPGGSIVIAVIDDGVQTDHPDLNIWTNPEETAGNDTDDDGNGWTDDVHGWDITDDDGDPSPGTAEDNHGTAVAGVAASVGGNEVGGKGMSYSSLIMPIRWSGVVPVASVVEAIRYAAGFHREGPAYGTWKSADVLNCSWTMESSAAITTAFDAAAADGRQGKGLPVFAASGNGASGYKVKVISTSDRPNGTYYVQWEYCKDPAGASGSDAVWLANVVLPDSSGTRERFDNSSLPAGWVTGGHANWTVVDDPAHSYGTGRYAVKSGSIGNSQWTVLRSNTFTLSPGNPLTFVAWVDSEKGTTPLSYPPDGDDGDWLFVWMYNTTTATWHGPWYVDAGTPGDRRVVSGSPITTSVSYPANLSSIVAVGASADWDLRSDYGQYGNDLDFVAPSSGGDSGITTTDRTGTNGYNTNTSGNGGDYTNIFGGTSSSSPLAAGIGALLLAKNPDLSADDVRTAMRSSADEIGSVTYTNGFNLYYGHGRINAYGALAMILDAPGTPNLVAGSDTGGSDSDNITKLDNHDGNSTLQFQVGGTVDGATVTLYDGDGHEIGAGTGNGGTISITTNGSHDLADGANSITARQTDSGKLPSAASAALETYIDTQAPAVTVTQRLTKDTTPELWGTVNDLDAEIEITVDGSSYEATNLGDDYWIVTVTSTLTLGTYNVSAEATDPAGNVGDPTTSELLITKADLNEDGFVGQTDLNIVLAQWGKSGEEITDPRADPSGDGFVGQADLNIVLGSWGRSGALDSEAPGGEGMRGGESLDAEMLDSEGEITLSITQVDGNEVIPGSTVYVTNVLTITTDSDWISGQMVVSPTGVSSPIYNPMSGAYAPYFSDINGYTDEEGQWVSGHPYYAYDSFVTAGMRTGLDQYYPEEPCYVGAGSCVNAADLVGSGGSAVWSTSAVDQTWWTMYDDEEGERVVAQVTLKDTAQGTWSFRATASPPDGPAVLATGTIVDGVMVPDE